MIQFLCITTIIPFFVQNVNLSSILSDHSDAFGPRRLQNLVQSLLLIIVPIHQLPSFVGGHQCYLLSRGFKLNFTAVKQQRHGGTLYVRRTLSTTHPSVNRKKWRREEKNACTHAQGNKWEMPSKSIVYCL